MTRTSRSRRTAVLLVGGLLAVCTPVGLDAHADTLADAQHQAAQLRVKVAQLQAKAELATEQYDAAYDKLGKAVTDHLLAERDLAAAQDVSSTTDNTAGRRVRALYMMGGPTALYAQVLQSPTLDDLAQSVQQVTAVLNQDQKAQKTAAQLVAEQQDATTRLARTAALTTALEKVVAARSDAVQALLDQADALLAGADARIRTLMAQQQAEADQVSSAQARATLAAARAAMGNPPEVPPNEQAVQAIAFAKAQLGKPYLWGGTGPDSYDCSGLTQQAYASAGVSLARVAADQWNAGPHIALGALMPGDLLFWAFDPTDPSTIHHVAMYLGNGMMIAAPHTGDVVKIEGVYLDGYIGATRPTV